MNVENANAITVSLLWGMGLVFPCHGTFLSREESEKICANSIPNGRAIPRLGFARYSLTNLWPSIRGIEVRDIGGRD